MQRCDVLIVGGGPAGSSCARALRQQGADVMLLDKAEFPRDKVCAGWITPAVVDALQIDLEDYASSRVLQPITGFRTGLIHGPEIQTDYDRPVSYGIRRCEFDDYLLRRSDARLRLGEPLRSLRRTDNEWIINDSIRTPLVVGAGGHFCPVARFLGAKVGSSEPTVAAKEIEFALEPSQQTECRVDGEIPQLYFCRDLKGYGWCFRKGAFLNVGIGREDTHRLSEHLTDFYGFLRDRHEIPEIKQKFNGHAYALYQHAHRKLLDDGVLLIGDAAGLAYPESGEGIRPAVESALIAADVIAGLGGDYRSDALAVYRERLRSRFGDGHKAKASLIPERLRQMLAGRLLTNHWFARHIVLDRWFLHHNQPAVT